MESAAFFCPKSKTVFIPVDENFKSRLYAVHEYGVRFLGESIISMPFPGTIAADDNWNLNLVLDDKFNQIISAFSDPDPLINIPYVKDQQH